MSGYAAKAPEVAKSVLEVAAEAAADKKGRRIVNGKVLLCRATKKYKKAVTLHAFHSMRLLIGTSLVGKTIGLRLAH